MIDKKYWDAFYGKKFNLSEPSTFASFCKETFLNDKEHSILEFGCGNGRDAFFFAENNFKVIAVDSSSKAIKANNENLKDSPLDKNLQFVEENIKTSIKSNKGDYNVIYSRFTLHAVNKKSENKIVSAAYKNLPEGGLFLLEFRTINDPLMKEGEAISKYERITTHYRRFVQSSKFVMKCINEGFQLKYFIEKDNLSVYKNDNPVLARIVLVK